jgi:16S rRNA (guanine966-N2)-methyltransferase
MRVIGGEFRSRVLKSLPGLAVRPTPDRLRETLFNVLAPRIEGSVFLDAFAGTGAVGIEALSRGAARAIFIEHDSRALDILRENLNSLKIGPQATVVRGSALQFLKDYEADIVFIDPPYHQTADYESALLLASSRCPLAIAQHDAKFQLADQYGNFQRTRTLRQGSSLLSFYEPAMRAT